MDSVVGSSKQPSMSDRERLPYTDAVLHEVQRMANILPLNLLHMAGRETSVGGFTFPKVPEREAWEHAAFSKTHSSGNLLNFNG